MTHSFRVGMVGVCLMSHGIASNILNADHWLCFLELGTGTDMMDHPDGPDERDL